MRGLVGRVSSAVRSRFGRRARAEQDLEDEIQFHLREEARLRTDAGDRPDEARVAAHRVFGNVQLTKERTREMWPGLLLDTVIRDLRFGVRLLARDWMFTALSVTTLALGIGAATAIFSVIQNVLLDPFDFNPDRIVNIAIRNPNSPRPVGRTAFQLPELLEYRAQAQSFEEVIAGGTTDVLYATREGTEQFVGGLMSTNNFTFLGVPAMLGRTLEPRDAEPGAPPVFVLGYKTWLQHFGGERQVIGRDFVLNGVSRTLVGIMSPRFQKLGADLYLPSRLDPADPEDRQRFYILQARLKPGVTEQQAQAEIETIARRVAKIYPRLYPQRFTVQVLPLIDAVVGSFRTTLYTLGAAVGLLLLIACANVANMLLARATAREREMALRASLGASRGRLVRQMLVESLLLAALAAGLGCVGAYFGVQALAAAIPDGLIPRQSVIRLNTPVLVFSLGIAIVTAFLCGLVPAVRVARRDVVEPLKDTGKGAGGGFRHRTLGHALVAAEVALSLVLLVGAGLFVRSFIKLQAVELGFEPSHVVLARLALPLGQYRTTASQGPMVRQTLTRIQALPGVTAATTFASLPPFPFRVEIAIPGRGETDQEFANVQFGSEGYLKTLGVRLLQGRTLSDTDVYNGRKVAVVNQTLATRYFGKDVAIGRTIDLKGLGGFGLRIENPVFEIVGIAADTSNQGLRVPPMPEAIVPYTVAAAPTVGLLVRTAGSPELLLQGLKREVWAVDRSIAVTDTEIVTEFLDRFSFAEPRFSLVVIVIFAVAGLILVAIGVFSIIAYTVSRRTHEIGIRMALGAKRADVMRMVLQTTMRVIGVGIGIGLVGSLLATRVFASQLFGVAPQDPATVAAVVAVVIIVGMLASYIPARQATRVDPMIALRHE